MIPVYVAIFAQGHMIYAFLVVVAAGLTDILDGYIARRTGQVTTAGQMLDPLADKLMFIPSFYRYSLPATFRGQRLQRSFCAILE